MVSTSSQERAAKRKEASASLKKRGSGQLEDESFDSDSNSEYMEEEEDGSDVEVIPRNKRPRRSEENNGASQKAAKLHPSGCRLPVATSAPVAISTPLTTQTSNLSAVTAAGTLATADSAPSAAITAPTSGIASTVQGAPAATVVHGPQIWPPGWVINTRRRDNGVYYDPSRYRPCSKDAGLLKPIALFNRKQNGALYKSCQDHQ